MKATATSALAVGVALALLCACGEPAAAIRTGTISGTVRDSATSRPLGGVTVEVVPQLAAVTTSSSGAYVISAGLVADRSYSLRFSRPGYRTKAQDGVAVAADAATIVDQGLDPTGAQLVVEPAALDLGGLTSSAVLRISNGGDPRVALAWTLKPAAEWLTVGEGRGQVTDAPSVVTVAVDRALLLAASGEYQTTIDLTSNGGSVTIPVRLARAQGDPGQLTPVPAELAFAAADVSLDLALTNPGAGRLTWDLLDVPPYLTVARRSGVLEPSSRTDLRLHVDRRTLPAGTTTGALRFETDGVAAIVSVPVVVATSGDAVLSPSTSGLVFGDVLPLDGLVLSNQGHSPLTWSADWPLPAGSSDFSTCARRPRVWTEPHGGALDPGAISTLLVHVDRAGLSPGPYALPVVLHALQGTRDVGQRTVVVSFDVPPAPRLSAALGAPTLTAEAPSTTLTLTGAVTDSTLDACARTTNVPLALQVSSDAPWLLPSQTVALLAPTPLAGGLLDATASPATALSLAVDFSRAPTDAGQHVAQVVVRGAGDPRTLAVVLQVDPVPRIRGTSPPAILVPKAAFAEAYDPFRDRLVFIGNARFDLPGAPAVTFELPYAQRIAPEHGDWLQLTGDANPYPWALGAPAPSQVPVSPPAMVYARTTGEMVMVLAWPALATWLYSPPSWRQVVTAHAPAPRSDFATAWDETGERLLLYGGTSPAGAALDDLWAFDGSDWAQLSPALLGAQRVQPTARMVYESAARRLLVVVSGGTGVDASLWTQVFAVEPTSLSVSVLAKPNPFLAMPANFSLLYDARRAVTYAGGLDLFGPLVNGQRATIPWIDQSAFPAWDNVHDRILTSDASTDFVPFGDVATHPRLSVGAAALDLGAAPSGTLHVANDGDAAGAFRVAWTAPWLQVSPRRAGTLAAGESIDLTIGAVAAQLPAGENVALLEVQGYGGQRLALPVRAVKP